MHAQSYLTLSRPLEPYSLPGSSLSKEIFRQEYWSGLSFPHQGDLSHPGIKPVSPASPALAGGFFYRCAIWETLIKYMLVSVREKAMAPHSSTLAWEIPWMVEPGRLQFMGSRKSRTWPSDLTSDFHFHALEKEMATHSSILALRIPGTGAWWAAVYGVAQSWTRLKWLSSSKC